MNFLTPGMFALAALAVPIIVLYMLRLRRREVPVSSTMLWQRLMQDREANAPWQRLRRNLLLLLQLLILAALVIGLARPFVPVPSVAAGSVALLLDASASMAATDVPGSPSRFEAARREARTLIGELAADEVMTVIAVGPVPEVLAPPTGDRAALRDALARAEVAEAPADWPAAFALAGASLAGREDATIVIVSDGGLPADLPPVPAEVRYLRVGQSPDNLAIEALAVRPLADSPQLFASVANHGPAPAAVVLSLEVDGTLLTAERLTVPAGESASFSTALSADARVVRAELTPPVEGASPDFLAVDDVAYAVYQPPVAGRVLLVTEGNLFLEQVFAALPGVEAFRADPGSLPDAEFDLIVFDGWLPADLPDTNLLIIDPPQTTNLFTVGGTFEDTRLARQADDPLLAFVDFEDVAVREAVQVQTPGWGRALVEAEGGALLIAGSVGGRRVAVLPFDLHASDLPLRIDFPILVANLLDWYAPAHPFEAAGGLRPGEPVVIRPQPATTAYRVTLPDGTIERAALSDEASPVFARTRQLGVYTVELLAGDAVTASGQFAVNLFDPVESAIAPQESIFIGQVPVAGAAPGDDLGQRELWPWLAGLALLVLAAEWWVYHRGSSLTPAERAERPRRRLFVFGRRS